MQFNEQAGRQWLSSHIWDFIPKNSKRYSTSILSLRRGSNCFGMQVDLPATEGKVIHAGAGFYVLKTDRIGFAVVDSTLLSQPLNEGATVRITPYQRRHFNGNTFSEPVVEDHGTYKTTVHKIGQNVSTIPVQEPKSLYTINMLELLRRGKCTDGIRLISNMLVDFNAHNVELQEPEMHKVNGCDPQFKFDCSTGKFVGHVIIGLNLGADVYYIQLQKTNAEGIRETVTTCSTVYFDQMAEVLETLLCDGAWKVAKVDVLKQEPKVKKHAAEMASA